jgi:O-antigen ligase
MGGGQGWMGERMLAVPALALIVISLWRVVGSKQPVHRWRLLAFFLLPSLLVVLPTLQLLPLPAWFWMQLPGRADIAVALTSAGTEIAQHRWSVAPFETERMLEGLLLPCAVYMSAVLLTSMRRRDLVALMLVLAAGSAFFGLIQILDGTKSSLYLYSNTNRGDAVAFFANRNHLGCMLAATMPLAVGVLADRLKTRRDSSADLVVWLLTGLVLILAVGVTTTRSRAAFVLLMISLMASTALMWQGRRKRAHLQNGEPWMRLAAGLAAIIIVQYTLFALLARLQHDPLEDLRWELAANTLQAAAPAMGTGYGLGSFVHAYEQIGDASASLPSFANHAHNDYLELWLEGGVVAVGLIALALVLLFIRLRATARAHAADYVSTEGNQPQHGLALGAALALAIMALHSIVDYPLRTAAMQAYAALLAAVLTGTVFTKHDSRQAG